MSEKLPIIRMHSSPRSAFFFHWMCTSSRGFCFEVLNYQKYFKFIFTSHADTSGNTELRQFYEMTQVEFGDIPEHVIKMYADSAEPL